ncbi:MAG: hypothetical protein HYS32_03630 [Candidatus Woesearchaeota archaeon]|nr:MAG: hypothetical protein HYS32_03630 [Candidatus Woesearchaeota archaeon]
MKIEVKRGRRGRNILWLGFLIVIINVLVQFGYLDFNIYFSHNTWYVIGLLLVVLGSLMDKGEKRKAENFTQRYKKRY